MFSIQRPSGLTSPHSGCNLMLVLPITACTLVSWCFYCTLSAPEICIHSPTPSLQRDTIIKASLSILLQTCSILMAGVAFHGPFHRLSHTYLLLSFLSSVLPSIHPSIHHISIRLTQLPLVLVCKLLRELAPSLTHFSMLGTKYNAS